jgi:2-haloacid dehalogenase
MSGGVTHLTFDCYGTLIDWEQGILETVTPLMRRGGVRAKPEEILLKFVAHEALLESQAWRPYREVLRTVLARMAADLGIALADSEANLLSERLPQWHPFPDTVDALKRLSRRFRLAIVSNVDDTLFAGTQTRLGMQFDQIITAEQLRSYKPGQAHFREAVRRLGVPSSRILHVAQSLYHDHAPAKQVGLRTAWINRPSRLAGTGLAPKTNVTPDLVFPDLASFAVAAEAGLLLLPPA